MVIAWADKIGGVLPPLIEGVYRKVSVDRKIGRRTSRVYAPYAGYNVFQIRFRDSKSYFSNVRVEKIPRKGSNRSFLFFFFSSMYRILENFRLARDSFLFILNYNSIRSIDSFHSRNRTSFFFPAVLQEVGWIPTACPYRVPL